MKVSKWLMDKYKIVLHLFLWAGVWLLVPLMFSDNSGFMRFALHRGLVLGSGVALLVITNVYLLLPQLYFKKKYVFYLISGICIMALMSWSVSEIVDLYFKPDFIRLEELNRAKRAIGNEKPFRFFRTMADIMPFLIGFIGSTLLEVATFANQREQEAIRLRNEKLETEMKFLRSQINPHFLFNALNNIYTQVLIQSEDAPDNLLKLSAMLRYMVYECNAETVPLKKEIEYLQHYIDLKKLKDSNGLNVKVNLDTSQPELQIAPLLFAPFVENAFKHSKVEDLQNGWIEIELKTTLDSVQFEVRNSCPAKSYTKDRVGGIGLKNVERQLQLLYPNQHDLQIEDSADQFSVYLKISLK